jgi:Cytochrome c oxidase caa3 assembly factor (Caa3_CtaG)
MRRTKSQLERGLGGERNCSGERHAEAGENRQVGVERDALDDTDRQRRQSVLVLQAAELALDGGAASVEVAPALPSGSRDEPGRRRRSASRAPARAPILRLWMPGALHSFRSSRSCSCFGFERGCGSASPGGRPGALAFFSGLAIAAGTVASPLDSLGEDDLVTAHVAQHIALGDFAAPLLLLGLPPPARRRLGGRVAGARSARPRRRSRTNAEVKRPSASANPARTTGAAPRQRKVRTKRCCLRAPPPVLEAQGGASRRPQPFEQDGASYAIARVLRR